MNSKEITKQLRNIIDSYLTMDLGLIKIPCPYWMNKIKDGRVVIRGQFDGKGTSQEIKKALTEALSNSELPKNITQEYIRKLAKRERIGIDCSGLVYRILDDLLRAKNISLSRVFPLGITKTNARLLTSDKFSISITKSQYIRPADLIRMMGGKHVLLVIGNDGEYIEYIHTSEKSTKEKGVHLNKIKITKPNQDLDSQLWLEETSLGQNFGKKYFDPRIGDGVKRLKIFRVPSGRTRKL